MPDTAHASRPALAVYKGLTRHTRYVPFERSFAYKLFLIDIDIDRLEEAGRQSACFSVDRPGLFSFHRAHHGSRKNAPLRPWAEAMFAKANIDLEGGVVRLVTLPKHLFYKFAPISLWFGYGPKADLRGVIYEVNNTFGETHAYVAAANDARNQHEVAKQLYVSPFFDVTGQYRFTLRAPDAQLSLIIENIQDDTQTRTHMASLKGKQFNATTGVFIMAAFARPLSSIGVSFAIHYQALRLWLRKAGYRSRPPLAKNRMTVAAPLGAEHESSRSDTQ